MINHRPRIARRAYFDPRVWGPHFWFFLHTIAMNYPDYPSDVIKRKYYNFVHTMPILIPDVELGERFSRLLDRYPVSPYLGKRESFIRWTVFIHNKMNILLGKPEMELTEAIAAYNAHYIPAKLDYYGGTYLRRDIVQVYAAIILALLLVAYMVYSD